MLNVADAIATIAIAIAIARGARVWVRGRGARSALLVRKSATEPTRLRLVHGLGCDEV